METVLAWILSFMVSTAPPGSPTTYVEAQESKAEATARYESIARDIVEVVYDPNIKPLFKGSQGRARTASVILSIMFYESSFRKNVDFNLGKAARGDGGKSWCLLQLNVGSNPDKGRTIRWNTKEDRLPRAGDSPGDIHPGFTGRELIADRKNCIKASLRGLRVSFSSCPKLPLNQKLRVYGSGSCAKGGDASAVRMNAAIRFWDRTKALRVDAEGKPWVDSDIVEELRKTQPEIPISESEAPLIPGKTALN